MDPARALWSGDSRRIDIDAERGAIHAAGLTGLLPLARLEAAPGTARRPDHLYRFAGRPVHGAADGLRVRPGVLATGSSRYRRPREPIKRRVPRALRPG